MENLFSLMECVSPTENLSFLTCDRQPWELGPVLQSTHHAVGPEFAATRWTHIKMLCVQFHVYMTVEQELVSLLGDFHGVSIVENG
jgi:hypothetical protein